MVKIEAVVVAFVVVVVVAVVVMIDFRTFFLVRILRLGLGLCGLFTIGFFSTKFFIPFCSFFSPLSHQGLGRKPLLDLKGWGQVEQCSSY